MLEKYWAQDVAGNLAQNDQPAPKESHQQALTKVMSSPTVMVHSGDPINQISLVGDDDYIPTFNAQEAFEDMEIEQEGYGSVFEES